MTRIRLTRRGHIISEGFGHSAGRPFLAPSILKKASPMDLSARQTLQHFLRSHQPSDALEQKHLGAMIEHAARLENPWSRHQATAHFTASALVVNADGTQVCLVHHAKLQRWLQPGGHIDSDTESLDAASLREAREE